MAKKMNKFYQETRILYMSIEYNTLDFKADISQAYQEMSALYPS